MATKHQVETRLAELEAACKRSRQIAIVCAELAAASSAHEVQVIIADLGARHGADLVTLLAGQVSPLSQTVAWQTCALRADGSHMLPDEVPPIYVPSQDDEPPGILGLVGTTPVFLEDLQENCTTPAPDLPGAAILLPFTLDGVTPGAIIFHWKQPTPFTAEMRAFFANLAPHLSAVVRQRGMCTHDASLFEAVVADWPEPICVTDLDGRIAYANAAFQTLIAAEGKSIGLPFSELMAEASDDVLSQMLSGKPLVTVLAYRGAGGNVFHGQTTAFPIWTTTGEGKPLAVAIQVRAITEQMRAEAAAQRTQQQLQALFDNMPTVVYLKDMDGRYILVNRQWRERTGLLTEDVIGKRQSELFPAFLCEDGKWDANEKQVVLSGQPANFEEIGRTTGRVYLATKFLLRDAEGNPYALCSTSIDITDRKQAEEAARRTQQQLQDMFDNTPAVVYVKDLQGRFIMVNREWRERIGLRTEDVVGKTLVEVMPDRVTEDDIWDKNELAVLQSGVPTTFEEVGRRTGSVYIAVKFPLFDSNGNIYAMGNSSIDITERKHAEEAAQRTRQQLQDIMDNTPAVVYVRDMAGRYIFVNREWSRRTGVDGQDVIGKTDMEIYPESVTKQSLWASNELQVLKSGQLSHNEEIGQQTGKVYLASKFMLRDSAGIPYALCNTSVDITERKEAEAERERLLAQIQEQARQVEQIISTVPEGVLLLNPDRQIILTNPAAETYLPILSGAHLGEILDRLGNRSLEDLLVPPPHGLWHSVESTEPAPRNFEVIAQEIETGPDGTGWVFVMRDVTREREIQQRIQQQERLAAVGQLAAGIAHDFNNIVAVIVLYVQLVLQTVDLPPKAQERIQTIALQARRATDLIEQVLDFSRRSVMERQPLELAPFIKEQVKLLGRTLPESIQIELDSGEGSCIINADPTRIQQVIMNLVVNARDAMPEGGLLHIGLRRIRVNKIGSPLPDMEPGEWVQITVQDSGMGIAADVLPHIFEPFFTTKPPGAGTGLGLSQVYGIVKQHEGHIDVISNPGQGTTFTLYLPALPVAVDRSTPDAPGLIQGEGEMILVVEDELATREALVASLEILNYRVLTAPDGVQALRIWQEHQSEIALVLSDVVMPNMGGIELFHELWRQQSSIKMILLTGHVLEARLENRLSELKGMGLTEWLQKPVSLQNLARTISMALR